MQKEVSHRIIDGKGRYTRLTRADENGRVCTMCNEYKPWSEFWSSYGKCKPCNRKYSREYYLADHERLRQRMNNSYHERKEREPEAFKQTQRKRRLKELYGLSAEQYDAMLEAQGGLCAICNEPPSESHPRLAVDHNHSTGAVRSLLCNNCNSAVGLVKESAERAKRIAEYITKWA